MTYGLLNDERSALGVVCRIRGFYFGPFAVSVQRLIRDSDGRIAWQVLFNLAMPA